jgi:hypothetical protein
MSQELPTSSVTDPELSSEEESSAWLMNQWIAAGIVASASRFVPVPFVDDIVTTQCRRFVVSTTLRSRRSTIPTERFEAFYGSDAGLATKLAKAVVTAPLKLMLFPVRKVLTIATSIHGVPVEIMRMVLIGRSLNRVLRIDGIAERLDADPTHAGQIRLAFETAFSGMDFRVIKAAVSDALASMSGWKDAAIELAGQLARNETPKESDYQPGSQLDSSATQVRKALDQPEIIKIFAEFDRRFDAALQRHS